MADLSGSYYWNSEYPKMRIDVSYSQTARTGTSATYRVNVALYFTSSGWYGFGMAGKVTINGVSKQITLKNASPSWDGAGHKGTWSFDITASAGTGGGTLGANVRVWGLDGDSTVMDSGSRTVNLSTWNTAPTWTSDDGNINGIKQNKIIAENTGEVTVNFPNASDKEGNAIKYDVYRYVNGSQAAKIASGTTAKSIKDNLSGYGQGTAIKYLYKCNDGSAWASGDRWSWVYTKNTLNGATISTTGRIGLDTRSISLAFSGASNTDGTTGFTYSLFNNEGITIYNASSVTTSPITFSIWNGSGTAPTTPYVKLDDLKAYTQKGNWSGTLNIGLRTTNSRGTNSDTKVGVAIDLKSAPTNPSSITAKGAITVSGGSYYVPSKGQITVTWNDGADRLGGSVNYDVYYKIDNGSWTSIVSNTTTKSAILPINAVSKETTCAFKIVTRTSYNYTSEKISDNIKLHYHNKPTITYSKANRTMSGYSVEVTSSVNTSIGAVAISSRSYVGIKGSAVNIGGSPATLTESGLDGNSTYTIKVTVKDNSGLATEQCTATLDIPVKAYIPILSITDKGIAISTTPESGYKLRVGGNTYVSGTFGQNGGSVTNFNNMLTEGEFSVGGTDIPNAPFSGNIYGKLIVKVNDGTKHNNSTNWIWQTFYRTEGTEVYLRSKTNDKSWTSWVKQYNTGFKPTASEIGAAPSSHTHSYLPTGGGTINGKLTINGANAGTGYDTAQLIVQPNTRGGIAKLTLHSPGKSAPCLQVGDSGDTLSANMERSGLFRITNANGGITIGSQNDGYTHYSSDRPTHWFNKEVRVQGNIYCGSGYNQQVPYGVEAISYNNGTGEPMEGRVHIGGNKYIYFGYCSISCSAGVSAERTYTIPNLSRIYGITINCYTRGGTGNYGELGLKQTYSNGFTFRLYNETGGGTHYVTYLIIGT